MRHERCDPDQRVVAPVGPAIALPPGAADGIGAHAVAHAELEDARERADIRQADDQLLQDADLGVTLHDPDQADDRRTRHHAVGVQHEHVIEAAALTLQEFPEIAGLVAVIGRAGADSAADRGTTTWRASARMLRPRPPRWPESWVSLSRNTSNAAASPVASRLATVSCRCRITRAGSSLWTGITSATRALIGPTEGERTAGRTWADGVAADTEDREADDRVPKADHVPWQHRGEAASSSETGNVEPAGAQDARHRPPAPSRPWRATAAAKTKRRPRNAAASSFAEFISPNLTVASTRTSTPSVSTCRSEKPSNRERRAFGTRFFGLRLNRSGALNVNGSTVLAGAGTGGQAVASLDCDWWVA